MSRVNPSEPSDEDSFQQLEEMIFQARNFVHPSADLRPRTLEKAREASHLHNWANRLTLGALGLVMVWGLAVLLIRDLGQHRSKLTGPFPSDIEQRAQELASPSPYYTEWDMVDAFQEERQLKIRGLGRGFR